MRIALPDERGRAAILRVHSRKLRLADDVSLDDVAEKTPSFSGAELAALCNEAAIRAARRGDQHVTQAEASVRRAPAMSSTSTRADKKQAEMASTRWRTTSPPS